MTAVTTEYTFTSQLDSNGCTIFANIIWLILWFQNLIIYTQRNLSALSNFNNHVKGMPDLEKGFPCRSAGKESTCNAGNLGSIPGLGRSPGEGKGYSLQYSGLENSMDCIVHGVVESETTEVTFTLTLKKKCKGKFQRLKMKEGLDSREVNDQQSHWLPWGNCPCWVMYSFSYYGQTDTSNNTPKTTHKEEPKWKCWHKTVITRDYKPIPLLPCIYKLRNSSVQENPPNAPYPTTLAAPHHHVLGFMVAERLKTSL